jgi:hypothetical protein
VELKEFIAETLTQIQEGVQDAINRRSTKPDSAGVINPVWGTDGDAIGIDHLQKVEFDVAVTVTDKSGGSGKAGIKVFSVELGGELSKGAEQSTASRIKFSIPIVPPVQLVNPIRRSEIHKGDA